MTNLQAINIIGSISANETRLINELSDREIEGYLIDAGIEETKENVEMIRGI